MKSTRHSFTRMAIGLVLIAVSAFSSSSCSTESVAERQEGITDVHQRGLERRATRQEARDARFTASRERLLN